MLLVLAFAAVSGARFEAEDAQLGGGVHFDNSISGYSGRGYVTGFQNDGDRVQFTVPVQKGAYEVVVGYHASDAKGFDTLVNDEKGSGMFPASGSSFRNVSIGKFFLNGTSKITISKGWGWYELDYVDVIPASVRPPQKPPKVLVNKNSTAATRSLFSFLVDQFGSRVLTGQTDEKYINLVKSMTGKTPAVGGFDFMDYSPSRVEHGAQPQGLTESYMRWGKSGNGNGIVHLYWHWNAPCDLIDQPGKEWWSGFYTYATTYDIAYALQNQGSEQYQKLLRDLDVIAQELKKFHSANFPVLWRPLHEAAGGWFWWGAKGPEPFKQLYRLMYTRFTQMHGLNNLIWVYVDDPSKPDWYPGDDVVDVVSLDVYTDPTSSMSGQWEALQARFSSKKLATLSESGTMPDPNKVTSLGTWWSWFNIWSDYITKYTKEQVVAVYSDKIMMNFEELPDWRNYRF